MWVLVIFFCSGATALIYELVWSKYLTLMLGSTVQAQTVVLAVFMGGLALGNRLVGKRSKNLARPLAAYGYLELFIGLFSFFFTQFFRWSDALFIQLGPLIADRPGWSLVTKGCMSVGLMLLPTMAMGGTLPVLAAWLEQRTPEAGRRTARLYAINSLGAVVGSGVAGFFLVRWVGLEVSLQMTAFVNLLVGLAAIGLDRRTQKAGEKPEASEG